ncbi:MAG: prephenate dehydrogenase [Bacteroidales bacterium]|nr:prephenate dehydrogenase [Bacteroidales bacterium]
MNDLKIPNSIAVIGMGLIGGSIAMELHAYKPSIEIIGVESNEIHIDKAQALGLVSRIEKLEEAINQSDLIIVCTPPDVTLELLPKVLDNASHQAVMDVCSVKKPLVQAVSGHPRRGRYLAAHPMAGTEYSGPGAAKIGLFNDKACIFCDTENTDEKVVALGKWFFRYLGMHLTEMEAADHDRHAAYVSHISHITSFTLANTVLEKEKSDQHIFTLASGGFDSTVRLAKSAASMWSPVFQLNKDNILDVLDNYAMHLKQFRDAIAGNNYEALAALIHKSNKINKVIK